MLGPTMLRVVGKQCCVRLLGPLVSFVCEVLASMCFALVGHLRGTPWPGLKTTNSSLRLSCPLDIYEKYPKQKSCVHE